jgi:carboxyl-terminal processing protease
MKVTTALYFLPGGRSTQKAGVAADVRLPGLFALEDIGEASLDYALPGQAIAPFMGTPEKTAASWTPVDERLIAALAAKSQARVSRDAKFARIIKDNKEAAEKQGLIQLDDYRQSVKKENGGKNKLTLAEQRQKARDQYAPFINETVNILLDMIAAKAG